MKSPPELWAEISDPESLAKHLEAFGDIRITRTDPETTVAWEGVRASGTVELEASGWGTKVRLTAEPVVDAEPALQQPLAAPDEPAAVEEEPAPAVVEEPAPPAVVEQEPVAEEPPKRRGLLTRLFRRKPRDVVEVPPPVPVPEPAAVAPEPVVAEEPPPPVEEPEVVAEEIRVARIGEAEAQEVLAAVLDTLGAAHHRPFSR